MNLDQRFPNELSADSAGELTSKNIHGLGGAIQV